MRTIIQHIGPLYGEANTGTVFGQPNGSIAVGQSYAPEPSPSPEVTDPWTISYYDDGYNVIQEVNINSYNHLFSRTSSSSTKQVLCNIALNTTISDVSAHMQLQLSTSQTFDSLLLTFNGSAGSFSSLMSTQHGTTKISSGKTYYIRLALFDSAGNNLGQYSNVLTFIGA